MPFWHALQHGSAPQQRLLAVQDPESILDRIQDYQAEKEAKAARAKEEEERRQLQECSFAPQINRQPVKAKVCVCGWAGRRLMWERRGEE